MIYKNGKQYDIPESDQAVVAKFLNDAGQLVLEWAPNRANLNPTKAKEKNAGFVPDSEKQEFPPSFPIVWEQTVVNKQRTKDEFRYFLTEIPDAVNPRRVRYEPPYDTFKNVLYITDYEKQWFLVFCGSFIENSVAGKALAASDPNYRAWLRIRVEEDDAKNKVEARKIKSQVENFILEIGEEDLVRELGGVYRIRDFESLKINVLRSKLIDELDSTILSGSKDVNYIEMNKRIQAIQAGNVGKNDEVAVLVTSGISIGALKYNQDSKAWHLQGSDGKVVGNLLKLHASQTSNKDFALDRALDTDPVLMKELKQHVLDFKAQKRAAEEAEAKAKADAEAKAKAEKEAAKEAASITKKTTAKKKAADEDAD